MVSQQTPVAIIGDANFFYLELQVDENDISLINTGMKVFVTLDSYRDSLYEARVSRIYPIMNERSRTFIVEAEFTKRPSRLFPHLSAEASIVIKSRENTLNIPRDYLINDSFVLLKSGKKIAVKTGLKDYNRVEIISGLHAEDELIKPE
jgi:multidrug efflux pump subunit AcrA (membrane-fusion protein)